MSAAQPIKTLHSSPTSPNLQPPAKDMASRLHLSPSIDHTLGYLRRACFIRRVARDDLANVWHEVLPFKRPRVSLILRTSQLCIAIFEVLGENVHFLPRYWLDTLLYMLSGGLSAVAA